MSIIHLTTPRLTIHVLIATAQYLALVINTSIVQANRSISQDISKSFCQPPFSALVNDGFSLCDAVSSAIDPQIPSQRTIIINKFWIVCPLYAIKISWQIQCFSAINRMLRDISKVLLIALCYRHRSSAKVG